MKKIVVNNTKPFSVSLTAIPRPDGRYKVTVECPCPIIFAHGMPGSKTEFDVVLGLDYPHLRGDYGGTSLRLPAAYSLLFMADHRQVESMVSIIKKYNEHGRPEALASAVEKNPHLLDALRRVMTKTQAESVLWDLEARRAGAPAVAGGTGQLWESGE